MKRALCLAVLLCALAGTLFWARERFQPTQIPLPTSKQLTVPVPGRVGRLNSFPATIALSPDGHYAAILNDGYGTQESGGRQSISVLDLKTNQIADFPDDRFSEDAHQSYFLGLAFSANGDQLYASVGSITDPTGEKPGDLGNGIAVYRFRDGKVAPERFIKISPQKLAAGKKIPFGLRNAPTGTAIPYPAGLALIQSGGGEKLLVANNLSDNVVLLDPISGRTLQEFDLSTSNLVPSSFPYTLVASRDGRHAWCSLWNSSRVAELDLANGKVVRWIPFLESKDPIAPGSHPTALLLSPDEKLLFVTLANADAVAVVSTAAGKALSFLDTRPPGQQPAGTYPSALAQTTGGQRLFVADASLNAVAIFDTANLSAGGVLGDDQPHHALGFIPTEWYPSALATSGDDLLIATAKGQGSGPNNGINRLKNEGWHHEHPYIGTLIGGSIARLNIPETEDNLADLTQQVAQDNLFRSDPGRITFARGTNPIRHVIYVIKENRTYDQVLGDLKVGNGDPSPCTVGISRPTSISWRCNSACWITSTTAGKSPVMVISGPRPPSPATTTRRPGKSIIGAKSAPTISGARLLTNTCSTTTCPMSMILPLGFSGITSPVTASLIATTASL